MQGAVSLFKSIYGKKVNGQNLGILLLGVVIFAGYRMVM